MLRTYPKDFSQVATSQVRPCRSVRPTRPACSSHALCPLARPSSSAWPVPIAACSASESLWEVAARVINPLGSRPWGNAFGKVPNTYSFTLMMYK